MEQFEDRVLLSISPASPSEDAIWQATLRQAIERAADLDNYLPDQLALTRQWVVGLTDEADAAAAAAAVGATVLGATGLIDDTYVWQFSTASSWEQVSDSLARATGVEFAYPLVTQDIREFGIPPNKDSYFDFQWHLLNTGTNSQPGGVAGQDANVTPVWNWAAQTGLGTGVVIGIVDDGLQMSHPDLTHRNVALSYDFNNDDTDPSPSPAEVNDNHGTSVAGVAAATGNNGVGVLGAAPNAELAGLRFLSYYGQNLPNDLTASRALSWRNDVIDVYNNSWGIMMPQSDLGPLTRAAIRNGVVGDPTASPPVPAGRGGLGNIYLFAAGNFDQSDDDVNYHQITNSRYVIAVGAVGNDGLRAPYSTRGAALLVSAHSNNNNIGIYTTDRTGEDGYNATGTGDQGMDPFPDLDYTSQFGGTSSATPLVAGVVALVLEANPNLTWRDVQHILVLSAQAKATPTTPPTDPTDVLPRTDPNFALGWQKNAAGLWTSPKYGFGPVNAQAAVALARSWTNVDPEQVLSSGVTPISVNHAIPDNDPNGWSSTISMGTSIGAIEHVEVTLNVTANGSDFVSGDLQVELTSPSGTKSILARPHLDPFHPGYNNWTFMSTQFWGETSGGDWTLTVKDLRSGNTGTWNNWSLNIYGTPGRGEPPKLVSVLLKEGSRLEEGDLLPKSPGGAGPRELILRFNEGQEIDPATLATGIYVIRSGGDDVFDAPGSPSAKRDVLVPIGWMGLGDATNEVIVRFAETLPDDAYRIVIVGSGETPLKNVRGMAFVGTEPNGDEIFPFSLDVGPVITAVVPQPVTQQLLDVPVLDIVGTGATIGRKTFTVSNVESGGGGGSVTFEFTNGTPGPGRVAINYQMSDTAAQLAQRVVDAINAQGSLGISATLDLPDRPTRVFLDDGADTVPPTVDVRDSGFTFIATQLVQARDQIVVYFNDDDLDSVAAQTLAYYSLFALGDPGNPLDDIGTPILPTNVAYSSDTDRAVLTFERPLDEYGTGTFRLRIGNEYRPILTTTSSTVAAFGAEDPALDSSFLTTANLGLIVNPNTLAPAFDGTTDQSLVITASIQPQPYVLEWPGAKDEPGHRELPDHVGLFLEDHYLLDADNLFGPATKTYNFPKYYGEYPPGNRLQNAITEAQKQRTREIFELFGKYLGVQFVEVEGEERGDADFNIITGDPRAIDPNIPTGPNGVGGIAEGGGGRAIMNNGVNWGSSEYGGTWFVTALHEIGHLLGFGHAYDLPEFTAMGADEQGYTGTTAEPVFPGDAEIVHGQYMYRPDSNDIDVYKFTLSQPGVLTAETIAERLQQASTLNSMLSLYDSQHRLIARNDDYFSSDSYLTLHLAPGTYYIVVTASGNDQFNPEIEDSGFGGTTIGAYDLRLNFQPDRTDGLKDRDHSSTLLDGDHDGLAGGLYNFWFNVQSYDYTDGNPANDHVLFVDKGPSLGTGPLGSPTNPYKSIPEALAAARPGDVSTNYVGDIVRIAGNNYLNDNHGRTLVAVAGALLQDGQSFVLADQTHRVLFEFDNNGQWAPNTVPVSFAAGDDAAAVARKITQAINDVQRGVYAGLSLGITASASGDKVSLTNVTGGSIFFDAGSSRIGNTLQDNLAYEIGFDRLGNPLADGEKMEVPHGVTVMIDAGATFKLRGANIDVGSSSLGIDRSRGVLQVLGTPDYDVYFTSYDDESIGVDTYPGPATQPAKGDWGGLVFRNNLDYDEMIHDPNRRVFERAGIFLNYVNHADMRYGGGKVYVDGVLGVYNPIHMVEARPTITYNRITRSADAAISADPNSFEESKFQSLAQNIEYAYTADYERVGPEVRANYLADNSLNGMFVRVRTSAGVPLDKLEVAGRFDDLDVVHVLPENLVIQGTPGGNLREAGTCPLAIQNRNQIVAIDARDIPSGLRIDDGQYFYLSDGFATVRFEFDVRRDTDPIAPTVSPEGDRVLVPFRLAMTANEIAAQIQQAIDVARTAFRLNVVPSVAGKVVTVDGPRVEMTGFRGTERGRLDARLKIDPGAFLKFSGSRIETAIGSQLLAEGSESYPIIMTSLFDDRYGAGGTFDTSNDGNRTTPQPGNWAGLSFGPASSGSIDWARIFYGGGNSPIEGGFDNFDVVEARQAKVRIANSLFQFNAAHTAGDRNGRGTIEPATIFVRGAQPIIVGNTFLNNQGAVVSIDANAMQAVVQGDWGRSTPHFDVARDFPGQTKLPVDRFAGYDDNHGPLVRANLFDLNGINGMVVRGGELTTETIWDDTDIAHVVWNEILVDNFHTYGGLRLQSSEQESLVVKLSKTNKFTGAVDANAGFTVRGTPMEIDDRIGGTIQVIGAGTHHVVFTSLADDTVTAGRKPGAVKLPQGDTDNTGNSVAPAPGDWRSIRIEKYSNDRNVAVVNETEMAFGSTVDQNGTPATAQTLGALAPNLNSGDDALRLGYEVHGAIRYDDAADMDVYRFDAKPGTEIWIDIDRTQYALDAIVELVDAQGRVLAWSDNSFAAEETDVEPSRYIANRGIARTMRRESWEVKDYYSQNPRDAGFRVVLPGPVPSEPRPYYVRVRAATRTLVMPHGSQIADGQTFTLATGPDSALYLPVRFEFEDVTNPPGNGVNPANKKIEFRKDSSPSEIAMAVAQAINDAGFGLVADAVDGTVVLRADSSYVGTPKPVSIQFNAGTTAIKRANPTGAYQLQVRLQELQEFPGSTIKYADIRYATNGIEVLGQPTHSPLLGETIDIEERSATQHLNGLNNSNVTAQSIGNLLASDREALGVGGYLTGETDVDFYEFRIDLQGIQSIRDQASGYQVNDRGTRWPVTIDLDYADGMARPDTSIYVFDSQGRLLLVGQDSSIVDDLPAAGAMGNTADLGAGSYGNLDPSIGPVYLPESNGRTYTVAVAPKYRVPRVLNERTQDPLLRREPVNSIKRIVEDHIGYSNYSRIADDAVGQAFTVTASDTYGDVTAQKVTELNAYADDFSLADVILYALTGNDIYTVNPFTGAVATDTTDYNQLLPNYTSVTYQDLAMRNDGRLHSITGEWSGGNRANSGHLIWHDTGNTRNFLMDGWSNINPGERDPNNWNSARNCPNIGIEFKAFAFDPYSDRGSRYIIAIGNVRGPGIDIGYNPHNDSGSHYAHWYQNLVYVLRPDGSAVDYPWAPPDPGGPRMVSDIVPFGMATVDDSAHGGDDAYNGDTYIGSDISGLAYVDGHLYAVRERSNPMDPSYNQENLYEVVIATSDDPTQDRPVSFAGSPTSWTWGFQRSDPQNLPKTILRRSTRGSGNDVTWRPQLPNPSSAYGRPLGIRLKPIARVVDANGNPINFTGLTAGPVNVENGKYSKLLFASDANGNLIAMDTKGVLQPVFNNGKNTINLGVGGLTGVAFSNIDYNLWHVTQRRWSDEGHGIPRLWDSSRDWPEYEHPGWMSMYFGLEDPRDSVTISGQPGSTDYVDSSSAWFQSYDMPGGAHGSLTTNEFSLKGYDRGDKPVLYFNYFAGLENSQTWDAFRVYISADGANWDLLGSTTDMDENWPDQGFIAGTNQVVRWNGGHELYENTGWRQARIDLSNYAGQEHLRIRFDFSTASDLGIGQLDTMGRALDLGGVYLRAVHGNYLRDGNYFEIDNGVRFEFDLGYSLLVPNAAGATITDGETFTITDDNEPNDPQPPDPNAYKTLTFEFDTLGNGVSGSHVAVRIDTSDSTYQVAQKVAEVVTTAFAMVGGRIDAVVDEVHKDRVFLNRATMVSVGHVGGGTPATQIEGDAPGELTFASLIYSNTGNDDVRKVNIDGTGGTNLTPTSPAADDFDPELSTDGSFIAFVSERDAVGVRTEIYRMAPDGSNVVRLSNIQPPSSYYPNYSDEAPTINREGTRIAFQRKYIPTGRSDIYLMNSSTGSIIRQLTTNPADDIDPAYSGDSSQIVFASSRTGGDYDLYVMDGNNGETAGWIRTLTTDDVIHQIEPDISADGTMIAWAQSAAGGRYDIYVREYDFANRQWKAGSTPRQLTFDGDNRNPSFSRDGRSIAFSRNGSLAVVRLSDGVIRDLGVAGDYPTWGPGAVPVRVRGDMNADQIAQAIWLSMDQRFTNPNIKYPNPYDVTIPSPGYSVDYVDVPAPAQFKEGSSFSSPNFINVYDGDTFTISDRYQTVTFEFEDLSSWPPGITPGNVAVNFRYVNPMPFYYWTNVDLANAIANAINGARVSHGLEVTAQVVQIGAKAYVKLTGDPLKDPAYPKPVYFDVGGKPTTVAGGYALRETMLTQPFANTASKVDGSLIHLLGHRQTLTLPSIGTVPSTEVSPVFGVVGGPAPLGYAESLYGDTPYYKSPGFRWGDRYLDPVRGQNNRYEGVYIDDIIIGFAERGEMVYSASRSSGYMAPADASFVSQESGLGGTRYDVTYHDPGTAINTGYYQVEIRRSQDFAVYEPYVERTPVLGHGDPVDGPVTVGLARSFDTNDRFTDALTIVAPAAADVSHGTVFEIGDGINRQQFQFRDPNLATSGTGIPIYFTGRETAAEMAQKIVEAINGQVGSGPNAVKVTASSVITGTASGSGSNKVVLYGATWVSGIEYIAYGDTYQPYPTDLHLRIEDRQPVFSPDGSKIAWIRDADLDGNYDIYVADFDYDSAMPWLATIVWSSLRRLTTSGDGAPAGSVFTNLYPAFSPDGQWIVYASNLYDPQRNPERDFEIFKVSVSGGSPIQLTQNTADDIQPSYSPDGTKIVFVSDRFDPVKNTDQDYELFEMSSNGEGPHVGLPPAVQLTQNVYQDRDPMYSPDGLTIVFSSNRYHKDDNPDGDYEIFTMPSWGGTATQLTFDNTNDYYRRTSDDRYPRYNPSGSRITFVSNRNGNNEIYVMTPTGAGQTRLTTVEQADDIEPVFTADGNQIVFASNRDPEVPTGDYDLYMIRATTGAFQTQLTTDNDTTQNDWPFHRVPVSRGDKNRDREQGQIVIEGNYIANSLNWGIVVDASSRVDVDENGVDLGQRWPHPGAPLPLRQVNTQRLVPGVTVMNNVTAYGGTGGILVSGDPNSGNDPTAAVPFARVVNNTVFGSVAGGQGIGIDVNQNAGPTLLNNIVAGLNIGIRVDASSQANTVVGATLYANNRTNAQGAGGPQGLGNNNPIVLQPGDPLFVDPGVGNFYPDHGSKAIDSSLDSLAERAAMSAVRSPLGIPDSPILAPERDLYGQLRRDDPYTLPPGGGGQNVFKDRGAIDRVDFVGPTALILDPPDNDAAGQDRNPSLHDVTVVGVTLTEFVLGLYDPDGVGINDATVMNPNVLQLRRDGVLLTEGQDYFYTYDATNDRITLFPAAGVWMQNSTYEIQLDNETTIDPEAIRDLANNLLQPNRTDGTTRFTVSLSGLDYGDAPDFPQPQNPPTVPPYSYPTLLESDGARHIVLTGFYLGQGVNSESADAVRFKQNPNADGDQFDDGIRFTSALWVGHDVTFDVTAAIPQTTDNPNREGRLDVWFDFNFDGRWTDEEHFSYLVHNGTTSLAATLPNVTLPGGAEEAYTYARFRLSRNGTAKPTGEASEGEVEDYRVRLVVYPEDFGDAPTPPYPTLLNAIDPANDGARHKVRNNLRLGANVSTEVDGKPSTLADADQYDDGIEFDVDNPMRRNHWARIWVTGSEAGGVLYAWIDYNQAGGWGDDSRERINFYDAPRPDGGAPGPGDMINNNVAQGRQEKWFFVPDDSNLVLTGYTFARFRLTSDPLFVTAAKPTGTALDGEVEDYRVLIIEQTEDFGDAPDSASDPRYPTFKQNNGARHDWNKTFCLGQYIDYEADGQPTATADGDDTSGLIDPGTGQVIDDEDGIVIVKDPSIPGSSTGEERRLVAGRTAKIEVTVTAVGIDPAQDAGYLYGWIDWDADGDWSDPGDQIAFITGPNPTDRVTKMPVKPGLNTLVFEVPMRTSSVDTFARFRLYDKNYVDNLLPTDPQPSYDGPAQGFPAPRGEVEDYMVSLVVGDSSISGYKFNDANANGVWDKDVTGTIPPIQLVTPGELVMTPNDDGSSAIQDFGFTFEFYGSSYQQFYVNNNGNVTFDMPMWDFIPQGFPQNVPMLAPFWSDVDTRTGGGEVRLARGISPRNQPFVQVDWIDVGYFDQHRDKRNYFTLYVEDDPAGDIVAFIYQRLEWTTGDLESPNDDGFGGQGAQIGFDAGDQIHYQSVARPSTRADLDAIMQAGGMYAWRFNPGTGQPGGAEPGLPGVQMYLDLNNNGRYDPPSQTEPGEPITVTARDNPATPAIDESGYYEFRNLFPGEYVVREIVPSDWIQTAPHYVPAPPAPPTYAPAHAGILAVPGSQLIDTTGPGGDQYQWFTVWDGLSGPLGHPVIAFEFDSNGSGHTVDLDGDGNPETTTVLVPFRASDTAADVAASIAAAINAAYAAYAPSITAGISTAFPNQPNIVYLLGPETANSQVIFNPRTNATDGTGTPLTNLGTVSLAPQQSVTDVNFGNHKLAHIRVSDTAIAEGHSGQRAVNVTLHLTQSFGAPVTVDWSTADGTALAGPAPGPSYGQDYQAASGTFTFPPQIAPLGVWQKEVVTRTADSNFNYAVSGNLVVWNAYNGRDWEVFLDEYDPITGTHTTRQVSTTTTENQLADVYDAGQKQYVVWSGKANDGTDFEVFLYEYDKATQASTITRLTNNAFDDKSPKVSYRVDPLDPRYTGGVVTWWGASGVGGRKAIYAYDLAGSRTNPVASTTKVSNDLFDNIDPQVDGTTIVWSGRDVSDYEVFASWLVPDPADPNVPPRLIRQTRQLTNNTTDDLLPQVSGNNVVWQGKAGSDNDIFLYRLDTDTQPTLITNNALEDVEPHVSGNNVVWEQQNGTQAQIFYYEIGAGGTPARISTGNYVQKSPRIAGNRVVWSAYDNMDWEVFYYEIGSGLIPRNISNNAIYDTDPQVADSAVPMVIWRTNETGNYSVIRAVEHEPEITGTITLYINGDTFVEPDEYFLLNLSGSTLSGIDDSQARIAILNDDGSLDYGDAPAPYPSLLAQNGARHGISPTLRLGDRVDSEGDGRPSTNALGDDAAGFDDEDGVAFLNHPIYGAPLVRGSLAQIQVTVSGSGVLNAWFDWNADGDWADPGEDVLFLESGSTNQSVAAGANLLSFQVPAGAQVGPTYARFRLSSAGGLSATGMAMDGEVEDYQVQIASPIRVVGRQVVAHGDDEDDEFTFIAGSMYIVVLNGEVSKYSPVDVDTFLFDGHGGYDKAFYFGDPGVETAKLWPDHGEFRGARFTVTTTNVEEQKATSGGGADKAYLYDSPGKDAFLGHPAYATLGPDPMTNPVVYSLRADGFRSVVATATLGGGDTANLFDSANEDLLLAYPQNVTLADKDGQVYSNQALNFRSVVANSSGGTVDRARFYDSDALPGTNDTFWAYPAYAYFTNSSLDPNLFFYNRANGFGDVEAFSRRGSDVARLYDDSSGPSDDQFQATVATATMTGSTAGGVPYSDRVNNFRYVYATASFGNDTATLVDSSGNDSYIGTTTYGMLSGPGFTNRANGFDVVSASSANGGTDTAKLYDSIGDDLFDAGPSLTTLTGPASDPRVRPFRHQVTNFAQVQGFAVVGGYDVAQLSGSAGTDQFWAYPAYAYLMGSLDGRSYYMRANSFEKVVGSSKGGTADVARLFGSNGGSTTVDTFVGGPILDFTVNPPAVTTRALMSDGQFTGTGILDATFTGGTYLLEANGFRNVFGESRDTVSVANDIARLYDYAYAADTFTGSLKTGNATMSGSNGYAVTAKKFSGVIARGDGVNDTAVLADSVFADWLEIDNRRARLFNKLNLNQVLQVSEFPTLRAQLGDPGQSGQPVNNRKITAAPPPGWTLNYEPSEAWWSAYNPNDPWWNLPWLQ